MKRPDRLSCQTQIQYRGGIFLISRSQGRELHSHLHHVLIRTPHPIQNHNTSPNSYSPNVRMMTNLMNGRIHRVSAHRALQKLMDAACRRPGRFPSHRRQRALRHGPRVCLRLRARRGVALPNWRFRDLHLHIRWSHSDPNFPAPRQCPQDPFRTLPYNP